MSVARFRGQTLSMRQLGPICLVLFALGGVCACQSVRRSTLTFLGVETGFSVQRYDDQTVAVLPVVTNPAFALSERDQKTIRDVLVNNLKVVAKFHPVAKDLPEKQAVPFPYLPQSQAKLGADLGVPATVGISVPSYEQIAPGSIRQLTVVLTFVDSLDPTRNLTATQTYRSDSQTEALNLQGGGFDWAVFSDLLNLDITLRYRKRIDAANANTGTGGPSVLALVAPSVVSPQNGSTQSSGANNSEVLHRTQSQTIPLHVYASDDEGLTAVTVENRTTNDQSVLLNTVVGARLQRYFDTSVQVNLALGPNALVVSATNKNGVSSSRAFTVQRTAALGTPIAFLSVAAIDTAIDSPALKALKESAKGITSFNNSSSSTTLSGSTATYEGILSSARDIDRSMASVHGASFVYFVGRISDSVFGIRLIPYASPDSPAVSGMPLEGFATSLAPRLVFLDLCANDTARFPEEIRAELIPGSGKTRPVAPVMFSLRNCAQPLETPLADSLVSVASTNLAAPNCVTLNSLVATTAAKPGVTSVGSLDSETGNRCIVSPPSR